MWKLFLSKDWQNKSWGFLLLKLFGLNSNINRNSRPSMKNRSKKCHFKGFKKFKKSTMMDDKKVSKLLIVKVYTYKGYKRFFFFFFKM